MLRRVMPFVFFAVLAVILLWPLAMGDSLLPAPMLGRMSPWGAEVAAGSVHWDALRWDGIAYFYPSRQLLARSLEGGELPLWNPYQMCGMPFLASPQSAVLYPPNWLFAVLPVDLTFGLLAFLHLLAAGSFTFLFLRSVGLGSIACTFGGTAFMLSGWSVVWLELPALLASGVWLPLTLYLVSIAWERRSPLHASLAGGAMALSLLGGHPQIWFYGVMAVASYSVFLAICRRKTTPIIWSARLAVSMLVVGFLLAAPQLLPTMELASLSHRGGGVPTEEGYQAYRALSMPFRHMIGLLVPDFYGSPARGSYWGSGEYAEFCGYVGMLPLILIPLSLTGERRRNSAFFAACAATALLMAMGTGVNRLLYFGIPGFAHSGSPARALYLYTFAVAVLGATGLDRLLDPEARRLVRVGHVCLASVAALLLTCVTLFLANAAWVRSIALVSAVDLLVSAFSPVVTAAALLMIGLAVAFLAAAGRVITQVAGGVAIGLLAADLLFSGIGYNLYSSRSEIYPETDAVVRLRSLAGEGRIMPINVEWKLRSFPSAVFPPNAATAYGLRDVQGYDSLYPVRYKRLLDAAAGRDSSPPENGNMVFASGISPSTRDLLGVRWLLSSERSSGALELARGCYAYENETALPRVFVVRRVRRTTDSESLGLIVRGEVDLRSEALVYDSMRPLAQAASGSARIRNHTCNRVVIDVDNPDAPGLLVLTDQHYPGWVARIEGKLVTVHRVNYCFRGVVVPKGRYTVVFSFEPRSLRNGLLLAFSGLLIVASTALVSGLRSRGGRL